VESFHGDVGDEVGCVAHADVQGCPGGWEEPVWWVEGMAIAVNQVIILVYELAKANENLKGDCELATMLEFGIARSGIHGGGFEFMVL
jgi:hypothetical protein